MESFITDQISSMLEEKTPEELLTSIYLDHEQAHDDDSESSLLFPSHIMTDSSSSCYPSIRYSDYFPLTPADSNQPRVQCDSGSSASVEKSHWKQLSKASKCFNPDCRKKFIAVLERPHNCYMCGEVFCKQCINYQRKLSCLAKPDTFGTFCNVCCKCYNHGRDGFGAIRDLTDQFNQLRMDKILAETEAGSTTLCGRMSSLSKQNAMMREIERLKKGFLSNTSVMKELMSELKTPKWQKSDKWSSKASECFHCQKAFNIVSTLTKSHCRIGGQVFCSNCSKDEIVIYLEDRDGEPKWGINGKSGGPQSTPVRYEMYRICLSCSTELQSMLLENISRSSSSQDSHFMDDIDRLHQSLSELQTKVKEWLAHYQQIVNTMYGIDCGSQSASSGIYPLAKTQADLSDALTTFSVKSQWLNDLKPTSNSEVRLRDAVRKGMIIFYYLHKAEYCLVREQLKGFISPEHLDQIQKDLSQQTMERVHTTIHQLMYEVSKLEKWYKLDTVIFHDLIHSIEIEFKSFLGEGGNMWSKHANLVHTSSKQKLGSGRFQVKLSTVAQSRPERVKYEIISQSLSVVRECYRELQAKTMDREFQETKKSFYDARLKLNEALKQC